MTNEFEDIKKQLNAKNSGMKPEEIELKSADIFMGLFGIPESEANKMDEGDWISYKEAKSVEYSDTEAQNLNYISSGIEFKEIDKDYYIDAFISSPDLDLVGDIVTDKAQKQMCDQIISNAHANKAGVLHERKSIPVGKAVEAKIVDGKLWVRTKLNKYLQYASPNFWNTFIGSVKDGFIDSVSIEYTANHATPMVVGGTKARVIDDITLLGYTFTGRPAQPSAKIENIYMKSFDVIKEEVKAVTEEATPVEAKEEPKAEAAIETAAPIEVKEEPKQDFEKMLAEKEIEMKELQEKLKTLEQKEAEARKIIELKESKEIQAQLDSVPVVSNVLVQKAEPTQEEKELADYKVNPTWDKAKQLHIKMLQSGKIN